MKAKLLKISMMTIVVIFLFAGASWADGGKNRHHNPVGNKHIRTEHDRSYGYQEPSHYNRRWYEHPRRHYKKHYDRHLAAHRAERHAFKHRHKYHRPVHKHDYYRYIRNHKYYHKHKPSYNGFSFRAPVFEPEWSITIKTKSRW
jgi:hypothetical protein